MPFVSLFSVLKYWNASPDTSELIATHCHFSKLQSKYAKDESNSQRDPANFRFDHLSGSEGRRLFKAMLHKYNSLSSAERKDGTLPM